MKSKFDAFEIVMALVVVGALAFLYFGTGKAPQGVVVFNMDRAHREMGRDKSLMEEIEKQEKALNKKLEELQSGLKKDLAEKKMKFGDSPTEEQQKTLNRNEQELAAKVAQETMKNRQILYQTMQEAISRFAQEMRPVTLQVAAKHRAVIVLNTSPEQVISFSNSADITDEVMEVTKQSAPSPVDKIK